jgi:putative ABC transport system substrate-binding protein
VRRLADPACRSSLAWGVNVHAWPSCQNLDVRSQIASAAARFGLPVAYGRPEFVEAGGLLSYGTNYREVHRRAAAFVDKILKGAKPADLPVEQRTKFELVINLKAATALGLTVPTAFMLRADKVIE